MKILIIEDEEPAVRHLTRLLRRYDPAIEVLAAIPSVKEAVRWFQTHPPPNLVFLDIHLSDALSFQIMEEVEITAPIIFTTAYDQYALQAFKVNSIDYLLKPVDLEDLRKAFEKQRRLTAPPAVPSISPAQIAAAWRMLNPQFKNRFVIKIGDHLRSAPVEEIRCFYSRHKITYLVNAEGRSYPTEYSLNDIEGLVDPADFFRISRQCIVRADAIREVVTYSKSRLKVLLDGWEGEDLVVSRERIADFRAWLDR